MRVLSLFDGISCGMIALKKAEIDIEQYVSYEVDKNSIKISNYNYPEIVQEGDVRQADFTQYKGFDLLIGGSPCQSFSIIQSKTRKEFDGKSGLYYEFLRALKEVKPKFFLLENVASMSKEVKDKISEDLKIEPILINSNCFVAQNRERYYWTNIEVNNNRLKECSLCLNDILENNPDEKYYYNCEFDFYGEEKKIAAKLNIKGHDILKRVSSRYSKSPALTTCGGGNTQKKVYIDGKCRKLTPLEYERLQGIPDSYTNCVANTHRYNAIGNGWTVDVIAYIFKKLKETN